MKVVFFGSANVALPILESLVREHQVLAVVTNPDAPAGRRRQFQESPVSALAKDLGLVTHKPRRVKGNVELMEELRLLAADIFVVVAYGKILPVEIIKLPLLQSVNVHFSVLPRYRGPSPIQHALLNGDSQTGTSIFILDEQIDHGPLLAQEVIDIDPTDNFFTLSDRLARLSAKLLLETMADYQAGKIAPLPQDEMAASYTRIIFKDDGQIDWRKSAAEVYNQFRAFYPWPGIWTQWHGKKLKISDCWPEAGAAAGIGQKPPGFVLPGGKVCCGEGFLELRSLQVEGRNDLPIGDFLNGYGDFVGSVLGR